MVGRRLWEPHGIWVLGMVIRTSLDHQPFCQGFLLFCSGLSGQKCSDQCFSRLFSWFSLLLLLAGNWHHLCCSHHMMLCSFN
uniref:Uncharacterized protein n=1 Tax=Populus trichocarpa TaxID=3694 RepID=A0A2K1R5V2_POPTR